MKITDDKDLIVHLETLSITDIINSQYSMTDSVNLIMLQHQIMQPSIALSYEDIANMFVNQINEAELSGSDSSDSFDQPED